ncbi:MAG: electron transfer flavoprotein subunit alpha/FixB family protein [Gaiellales bacterium]
MSVLVYLETASDGVDEASLQALTLARTLADGAPVAAIVAADSISAAVPAAAGLHGADTLHAAEDSVFATHAPLAAARAVVAATTTAGVATIVGPGTETGNEVLAHAAAILDAPLAANCLSAATGADGIRVTRVRWGGSLLEEAIAAGPVVLLTAQAHAVTAAETGGSPAAVSALTIELGDADRVVRVIDRVEAAAGGISLADAKVVVTGGRGVGSAEGFASVEELAATLGGAVGCSRAVTIAGWRPHTDQVGQTGTKVAPDLYIACGVSGATQHMAGCKGAKKILAVNTDREASIIQNADYAVIGDLHEVLPAISAELRRVRGE